jgi:hypothetical protein
LPAGPDRINALPDLATDVLPRFPRLLEAHAAQAHFPPLAGVVINERPSSSAGCIDDEVKPIAIGVVAGLGDRFDLAR